MAATKKKGTSSSRKKARKSLTQKSTAQKAPEKKLSAKSSKGSAKKSPRKLAVSILIWCGVLFISFVLVDYAAQYLKYSASVALVNGERIYRGDYYDKLDESYGSAIVSQMIDEALIYQEAEKEGIEISDNEIEAEMKTLEENYGGEEELQKLLDERGITDEKLRKQIETTLIVEKALEDDIEITEEEKKERYEEYKEMLTTDGEEPTYEEVEDQITEMLREEKISQLAQTWIAGLREEADIRNNIDDPKGYEFLGITRALILSLTD